MRVSKPSRVTPFAASFGLLLLGCGPSFDPPSELHSLRVLAVQKDVPYAQPGERVKLDMLWVDATPKIGRDVEIAWSPPCFNPGADLYYGCFADPSKFSGELSFGESTEFTLSSTIISDRLSDVRGNNAPYGIAYIFFAVCAGTLEFVPPTSATAFPFVCRDAGGNLLGSDDFVAGYTAVYAFQGFSNQNPVITGFEFNQKALSPAGFCLGNDCNALAGSVPPAEVDCGDPEQSLRCIPTCADDGDPKCTGYKIRPTVDKADPANQDEDSVSAKLLGRHVGEQMWIDYYTGAGGFKSPVRLLNDATTGWNDDYGTEIYAPKAPGPFRVWAVVHDNRGGAAWAGVTLQAQ